MTSLESYVAVIISSHTFSLPLSLSLCCLLLLSCWFSAAGVIDEIFGNLICVWYCLYLCLCRMLFTVSIFVAGDSFNG